MVVRLHTRARPNPERTICVVVCVLPPPACWYLERSPDLDPFLFTKSERNSAAELRSVRKPPSGKNLQLNDKQAAVKARASDFWEGRISDSFTQTTVTGASGFFYYRQLRCLNCRLQQASDAQCPCSRSRSRHVRCEQRDWSVETHLQAYVYFIYSTVTLLGRQDYLA